MSDEAYSPTPSVWALYDALWRLEHNAGVQPGEPFKTRRAEMMVESRLSGITLDCSLIVLERDQVIRRVGERGVGTTITILKRYPPEPT